MRLLIALAALYLSVVMLQLSTGGVAPLDVLSGFALGFSTSEIGLLGSSHFIGFFIGCWWAPRLIGRVGHSRTFSVFTVAGAMGLLAHTMTDDPLIWAVLRVASGMCVAGCYSVIEAWLNANLTNENRGRATGTYRVVDMGASMCAQLVIGVLEPASYISYNILALVCCAALLPLALTRLQQPETTQSSRLRPALAYRRSPLAVAAVIVAGLTSAAFRMVGPIYGTEVGLGAEDIGLFLAAFVLGGALAQYPAGWLADKYDRRWVLVGFSFAAILASIAMPLLQEAGRSGVFLSACLFGIATFPIYSVAAAHAHDFAEDHERAELSASLLFYFAVGAIASPLLGAQIVSTFGPSALFVFLASGHVVLIAFSLQRMLSPRVARGRTNYIYTPRTTFQIGRLLSDRRTAHRPDDNAQDKPDT
ncbi:MFS transporter [Chachezhania antarctica]|uniref:MFS transporter n=1 Tax=Chachezhania antarctica TaxID=2340860 RepID=UPI000EB10C2F|nr:MFS transporter [Chachezhania antarctica]|tara:strand:- start:2057 stop:3316 length:1260 start_codon:yes stop_codon:yes gene_type:complete